VLDWLDYRIWDARLRMVDALYGPEPETEADRERNCQERRLLRRHRQGRGQSAFYPIRRP
jgi:hypothetical protein